MTENVTASLLRRVQEDIAPATWQAHLRHVNWVASLVEAREAKGE
jgi:hypothetical protein